MAEQDDLRVVAGKAIADPVFRQKLLDDPEAAVKEAGITLSPEQMKSLKEMDKAELEKGMIDLDSRLTMACWGKVQQFCGWD
jgi:tRNA(Ser,Leu) C12 N-acetylase TAN1